MQSQANPLIIDDISEKKLPVCKTFTQLKKAAEDFPDDKDALIAPVLNDPKLYNQIISADFNPKLIDLIKIFPNHAKELIQFPYNHPDKCKPVIHNFITLTGAAMSLPEHKAALIAPFLNDPDPYNELIFSDGYCRLASLLEHFPDQAKELLEFPDKHPEKCRPAVNEYSFIDVLRELPEHLADVFINTTLNTREKFKRIFPSHYFLLSLPGGSKCKKHEKMIIGFIINDIKTYINNKDEFDRVIQMFPEHKNEVLEAVLNKNMVQQVFDWSSHEYIGQFPEYEYALKLKAPNQVALAFRDRDKTQTPKAEPTTKNNTNDDAIENEKAETSNLVINNIDELTANYQAHTISIDEIARLLANPEAYKRLVPYYYNLIRMGNLFPDLKDIIIKPVITSREEHERLIASNSQLIQISEFFPDHKDGLIKYVLEDRNIYNKLISTHVALLRALKTYPNHQQQLIAPLLEDTDTYNNFITNDLDLTMIAEYFSPEQKNPLLLCLINQPEKFKKMLGHHVNRGYVAEAFPDFAYMLNADSADEALKIYHAKNNTNTNTNTNTTTAETTQPIVSAQGLFANNNATVEKKICRLFTPAYAAVRNYLDWYNKKGECYRGGNGWLSSWNHSSTGKARAEKLQDDLQDAKTDDAIQQLIENFLNDKTMKVQFENHSLATFLMDSLSRIEDSPWKNAEARFPGYKYKEPVSLQYTFCKK